MLHFQLGPFFAIKFPYFDTEEDIIAHNFTAYSIQIQVLMKGKLWQYSKMPHNTCCPIIPAPTVQEKKQN